MQQDWEIKNSHYNMELEDMHMVEVASSDSLFCSVPIFRI